MSTNDYRRFVQLLPDTPLVSAEVLSHNGDGTSTVQTPDGATFRARGQGVAVGNNAFVRGGDVGLAPRFEAPFRGCSWYGDQPS
jgi:hypothetical protein